MIEIRDLINSGGAQPASGGLCPVHKGGWVLRFGRRFRPLAGDEPVGKFAYMVHLRGPGNPDRSQTPETLVR